MHQEVLSAGHLYGMHFKVHRLRTVSCVVYARMRQQSTQRLQQEKVEEWLQTIKALIQKDMRTNPTLDFETGSFLLAADMSLHQSTPVSEFIFICVGYLGVFVRVSLYVRVSDLPLRGLL